MVTIRARESRYLLSPDDPTLANQLVCDAISRHTNHCYPLPKQHILRFVISDLIEFHITSSLSQRKMIEDLWPTCFFIASFIWLCTVIYRASFAPLAKLPGPHYSTVTGLWLMKKEFASERREYIHQLHKQHGAVVRLGPNEVSFTSLAALKEIYTSGGSGYDKTEFYSLFTQFGVR